MYFRNAAMVHGLFALSAKTGVGQQSWRSSYFEYDMLAKETDID